MQLVTSLERVVVDFTYSILYYLYRVVSQHTPRIRKTLEGRLTRYPSDKYRTSLRFTSVREESSN